MEIKHRARLPAWLIAAGTQAPCRLVFSDAPKRWQRLSVSRLALHSTASRRECGDVRPLPDWLRNALDQADGASAATGKPPLVVLHAKGMRYGDCICLRWGI